MTSLLRGKAEALRPVFESNDVSDILINGTQGVYIEREGRGLERLPDLEFSEAELSDWVERILLDCGKRLDLRQPFLDGALSDSSRFHIIIPPLAPSGPIISIRRWKKNSDLTLSHFAPTSVVDWLGEQVRLKSNILIVGGTGSGKTTLLGKLLDQSDVTERILLIEESAEIRTCQTHVVRLHSRSAMDGMAAVGLDVLIRNALRMRPDRIVIGESRGGEAFHLLQAMNTGHRGVLSTLHANTALDGVHRLEALAHMGSPQTPLSVIRHWISVNLDMVLYVSGKNRRVTEVLELKGLEGNRIRVLPRFEGNLAENRDL